ncbi:hypothetical protein TNCV_788251 [Trichonephila clavipes]|nr:hypothetical protein TNCV_788251 [Trichonephila clavipes]
MAPDRDRDDLSQRVKDDRCLESPPAVLEGTCRLQTKWVWSEKNRDSESASIRGASATLQVAEVSFLTVFWSVVLYGEIQSTYLDCSRVTEG